MYVTLYTTTDKNCYLFVDDGWVAILLTMNKLDNFKYCIEVETIFYLY